MGRAGPKEITLPKEYIGDHRASFITIDSEICTVSLLKRVALQLRPRGFHPYKAFSIPVATVVVTH